MVFCSHFRCGDRFCDCNEWRNFLRPGIPADVSGHSLSVTPRAHVATRRSSYSAIAAVVRVVDDIVTNGVFASKFGNLSSIAFPYC
jgi:hypothetical protein